MDRHGKPGASRVFQSIYGSKSPPFLWSSSHRGISVLIFEATAIGYLEAERMHKHFSEEGRDRDAWERRRTLFYPGHKRQLLAIWYAMKTWTLSTSILMVYFIYINDLDLAPLH